MGRVTLIVLGVGWALFGVACLVAPAQMLKATGLELSGPQSFAEVRAMYGGAPIGFGAFLLYASQSSALIRPALMVTAMFMGGFALGRIAGIVVDGSLHTITLVSLATEVGICLLALVALGREAAT